jgi:hypothetical protein
MHTQEYRYKEDPETSGSILVQQALNEDQDTFEALVSRYKQSLFGLINRSVGTYHETEDILQQGILHLSLSLSASKLIRRKTHAEYTEARSLSSNDVLAN